MSDAYFASADEEQVKAEQKKILERKKAEILQETQTANRRKANEHNAQV